MTPPAPATEGALVEAMLRLGRRQYGRDSVWGQEVRSHGRARTDVVVYADGRLIAFEAKLHQWPRAIRQALFNTYYADESFVVLWAPRISKPVLSEAGRFGLGVLGVDSHNVQIVRSPNHRPPNVALRGKVLEQLLAGTGR